MCRHDGIFCRSSPVYENDFGPEVLNNIFGEVVAEHGLTQLRIAETEKYAHVTFFFNGGEEKEFKGEDRILIPSPKVATYDLKPEMSVYEVTDKLVDAIENQRFDVIICNFANGDMVGHTGIMEAALKAVAAVDECVGRVAEAIKKVGGVLFITADHGNAEKWLMKRPARLIRRIPSAKSEPFWSTVKRRWKGCATASWRMFLPRFLICWVLRNRKR